jgi:hypothetical protein
MKNKPYYRSKPVTVQARKDRRDDIIAKIATVIFVAFAFIGMGYIFSLAIFSLSKLF